MWHTFRFHSDITSAASWLVLYVCCVNTYTSESEMKCVAPNEWAGYFRHLLNSSSWACSMIYSILNFHSHKSQMNTKYSALLIVTHTASMTCWLGRTLFCLNHYLTKDSLAKEKEVTITTILEVVFMLYQINRLSYWLI